MHLANNWYAVSEVRQAHPRDMVQYLYIFGAPDNQTCCMFKDIGQLITAQAGKMHLWHPTRFQVPRSRIEKEVSSVRDDQTLKRSTQEKRNLEHGTRNSPSAGSWFDIAHHPEFIEGGP